MQVESVEEAARRWLAEDPDDDTRRELQSLLEARDEAALVDRFATRLAFGTAGLRGAMGAGPNRMNRATVRYAAAGLATYVRERVEGAPAAGVVVGYDARHKSHDFAHDTARVLAGAGVRVLLFPSPVPTPLLAFAVRHLGTAAGVMVTASHNPARDNGYKVYAADGGQIIPPVDQEIAAAIAAFGSLEDVRLADEADPRIAVLDNSVIDAYVAMATGMPHAPECDVRIAYTPLHGVGRDVFLRVLGEAGFAAPAVVASQAEPDPDFPTVGFPNPEEAGAIDALLAEASAVGADVAIAHDPDADRLSVVVVEADGYRQLSGDEVGCLLGHHLLGDLEAPANDARRRLVVTTVVSSRLLQKIAAAAGAEYAETLTGFKWLCRPAIARPDLRPVLAYEEALGYAVAGQRDKDGITAALVVVALAAHLKARGSSIAQRLREIDAQFGAHVTAQWSMRRDGPDGGRQIAAAMEALRRCGTPPTIGGRRVLSVHDLLASPVAGMPPTDALTYELDGGARVVVRPSGTEPKAKVYAEVVAGDRGDGRHAVQGILATMRELLESAR